MDNKNKGPLWLITGISLILFSTGILTFTATNSRCQIGPAMCSSKNWGAYIGLFLSAIALLQFFLISFKKNQSQNARIHNSHYGLLAFGILMIVSSIIMTIIGFTSKSLNSPAAITPGAVMVILAIPITIAGIIITCFGIYNAIKIKKHPEKENNPILLTIFIIGIVAMLFLLLS